MVVDAVGWVDAVGSGGCWIVVGGADVIGLVDVVGDGVWRIWPDVVEPMFNFRG